MIEINYALYGDFYKYENSLRKSFSEYTNNFSNLTFNIIHYDDETLRVRDYLGELGKWNVELVPVKRKKTEPDFIRVFRAFQHLEDSKFIFSKDADSSPNDCEIDIMKMFMHTNAFEFMSIRSSKQHDWPVMAGLFGAKSNIKYYYEKISGKLNGDAFHDQRFLGCHYVANAKKYMIFTTGNKFLLEKNLYLISCSSIGAYENIIDKNVKYEGPTEGKYKTRLPVSIYKQFNWYGLSKSIW